MRKAYLTNSPAQTKKLGEILAQKIKKGWRVGRSLKTKTKKAALIIGLEGDLGGGKTTFLKGFARGLGIKQKILSPTFIIIKRFKIKDLRFKNFYHIDCYRIEKPKEILDLGFKEIIQNPKNIIAIEWSDKVQKILPQKMIKIRFKVMSKNTRQLTINNDRPNLLY